MEAPEQRLWTLKRYWAKEIPSVVRIGNMIVLEILKKNLRIICGGIQPLNTLFNSPVDK